MICFDLRQLNKTIILTIKEGWQDNQNWREDGGKMEQKWRKLEVEREMWKEIWRKEERQVERKI